MWLRIEARSSIPVYQQVVDGVKSAVAKRLLQPGDRLPAVRDLATELTVNHNTVQKAYQELEREHVIEVVRGKGTYISRNPSIPNERERREALYKEMVRWVIEAHHLRIRDDELLKLLRTAMQDIHQRGDEGATNGDHCRGSRELDEDV